MTAADTNWRLRGNCVDVDPDVMHPDPRDRYGHEQANDVCNGCTVATECFLDSIRLRDWNGVRAEMSGEERKAWYEANVRPRATRKRVAA